MGVRMLCWEEDECRMEGALKPNKMNKINAAMP